MTPPAAAHHRSRAGARLLVSRLLLAAVTLFGAVVATLVAVTVQAVPAGATSSFTPGDIVVYRVGDGSGGLSSAAAPVYMDEYSPSGSLVQSVALPTTASAPNNPLVASGSATSEGLLTLSADSSSLIATGYDATVGTSSIAGTAAASTPRTVATISGDDSVNTSTALTDFSDGNNPRSATSTDGTHIWVGGAAGDVRYTTLGSTTSTPVSSSTFKNVREVSTYDGQLYASADPTKAGLTIGTVGSGLPTSGSSSITNLPFSSPPSEPYGYAFLTLGTGTAPDTLYVADNGAGAVVKYGLVSGSWVQEGSVSVPNVLGLTANDSGGTVTIFATTSTGTDGTLVKIVDASGLGGTLSGTATTIANASSDEAFRGVAFAPGTVIGSGSSGETGTTAPTISTSDSSLPAAMGDPTNPTLGITVGDTAYSADQLTVTATSSDTSVAPQSGISVTDTGADRTLTVTPGTTVGYSTITLTVTAPDGTSTTAAVTYGLSADLGDPSDRYFTGAGNASSAVDVGGGYMLVADDLSDVLRLYNEQDSGPPVKTFDFTSVLPDGATTMDLEAAARSGNMIYWLGSQSNSDSGDARPAATTLFATEISGSGADTTLTYVGSYTGLRQDLINWDESNGNPLGLAASAQGTGKSVSGLNVEGLEFAPGSSTTAYLAFRAPLEPTTSRADALLVPVTNLSSLVAGNPGTTTATFGAPLEWNLGGLGIREIRANADGQYLVIAGTSDGSDDAFALYTWDGNPSDQPLLSPTVLPAVADGAWESIVSVPDPLVAGASVQLLQDDGDTAWYGDDATSKGGLATGLQKDLGRVFTYLAPVTAPDSPTGVSAFAGDAGVAVSWTAPTNDGGSPITGYTVTVTPTAGGTPVTDSPGASATSDVLTGLTDGAAYDVSVVATNSVGSSAAANASDNPVTPSAASTTLTVSPGGSAGPGSPVALTATVSPAPPVDGSQAGQYGQVVFSDGATVLGTSPVDATGDAGNGTSTLTTSALALGEHQLTAQWSDTPLIPTNTSDEVDYQVGFTSTTTLSSSANPANASSPVTLTATVSPEAGATSQLTGDVSFLEDGNPITSCQDVGLSLASPPTATCQVTISAGESHSIVATYGGDANFTGSSSDPLVQVTLPGTATFVISMVNPSPPGAVTFWAGVGSSSGSGPTPTGTVAFVIDGKTYAPCGAQPVGIGGGASCTVSFKADTTHTLVALFAGSSTYSGSSSGTLTQTVTDSPGSSKPQPPPKSTTPTALAPGQTLRAGRSLRAGSYRLTMQTDGNLVEYRSAKAIWHSGTSGRPGAGLVMQKNGNLVEYWHTKAIWATKTAGHPGSHLTLQGEDGNVVIYTPSGRALWATGT